MVEMKPNIVMAMVTPSWMSDWRLMGGSEAMREIIWGSMKVVVLVLEGESYKVGV